MTNKIHVLSAQVANQIAAGEVIERPSSIVKELMENSLDAGSDDIIVNIKHAGNGLISITDNGDGISKDDLPLAICQHATSKLNALTDLESIASLGFRGEALASICSAAKMKIVSRARDSIHEYAWSMEVNGDPSDYHIAPASHPIGTTIEVRDLFFNIPVRRRFLKAIKTEYQHILEIFQKIALSNFNCAFTLIHDEKIIYKLPKAPNRATQDNRIKKIFGYNFIKDATYFEGKASSIKLSGWLGHVDYHRSQSDQQYFFLNNRIIRDKLIIHAIKFAFDDIIPPGRYPCYVFYLELDPNLVDVNVHPTKHEVRFCEPRWIHQFIVQQLHNVLNNMEQNNNEESDEELNLEYKPTESSSILPQPSLFAFSSQQANNKATLSQVTGNQNFSENTKSMYKTDTIHVVDNEKNVHSKNNIILSLINNHYALVNRHSTLYIVDLIASYKYLALNKTNEQWQTKGQLESFSPLLQVQVSFAQLYSKIKIDLSQSDFLSWLNINLSLPIFNELGLSSNLIYMSTNNNPKIELEFVQQETGEVVNGLVIHTVPLVCRYVEPSEIWVKVIRCLILSKQKSVEPTELFLELAELSLGRLKDNLVISECYEILDKLAKKVYTDENSTSNSLVKKLTAEDCAALLAQRTLSYNA